MTKRKKQQANQLSCILLLLCRQPLTEVVNRGAGQGTEAWRRLVDVYGPDVKSRIAGQMLGLSSWNFAEDVEARLALFERDVQRDEQRSGEHLSVSHREGGDRAATTW